MISFEKPFLDHSETVGKRLKPEYLASNTCLFEGSLDPLENQCRVCAPETK